LATDTAAPEFLVEHSLAEPIGLNRSRHISGPLAVLQGLLDVLVPVSRWVRLVLQYPSTACICSCYVQAVAYTNEGCMRDAEEPACNMASGSSAGSGALAAGWRGMCERRSLFC
jgi:hypothetical protein